ncbi:tRNA(Ile)-lysidine synthase [Neisseria gonorrhoeae]|uniref:tRNA(Ile)-lysidine synthase n=1 Tax=Neisseria gonorrhoeae TaxID=485 RepID=A0A378VX99_NEIGO|nr:tRNA(Ile)-lysidine synthase [Neisseria gonorrhoeae]
MRTVAASDTLAVGGIHKNVKKSFRGNGFCLSCAQFGRSLPTAETVHWRWQTVVRIFKSRFQTAFCPYILTFPFYLIISQTDFGGVQSGIVRLHISKRLVK